MWLNTTHIGKEQKTFPEKKRSRIHKIQKYSDGVDAE